MNTDRKTKLMQETINRLQWENERKDAEIDSLKTRLDSLLPMKTWRVNDKPVMRMMRTEYPNNAELIITSNFAEIRYTLTDLNFLDKESSIAVSGEELSEFLLATMKDCVVGTDKDMCLWRKSEWEEGA